MLEFWPVGAWALLFVIFAVIFQLDFLVMQWYWQLIRKKSEKIETPSSHNQ